MPPRSSPFDPGYDPGTLEGHLEQSAHLMAELKISMACWLIADEGATRRKVAAARAHGVPAVTGGGPFEIAVAQGVLPDYLDLCADVGMSKIECGRGFTDMPLSPDEVVGLARERDLAVEVELGGKHTGAFDAAQSRSSSPRAARGSTPAPSAWSSRLARAPITSGSSTTTGASTRRWRIASPRPSGSTS